MHRSGLAYLAVINGHSIGDTLNLLSFDLRAQLAKINLYWLVHCGHGLPVDSELHQGWFHFELFRLYERAGMFRRTVLIEGVNSTNAHSVPSSVYCEYVNRVYGETPSAVLPFYEHPELKQWSDDGVTLCPELRDRFSFLSPSPIDPPYATVHPVSSHFIKGKDVASGVLKRISYASLTRLLPETHAGERRCHIVIVGSNRDAPFCALLARRLRRDYPAIDVSDWSGGDLVTYFRLLYGSRRHLSCETNSAFFTSQVGIESTLVYLRSSPGVREHFARYFKRVSLLTHVLDTEDCLTTAAPILAEYS